MADLAALIERIDTWLAAWGPNPEPGTKVRPDWSPAPEPVRDLLADVRAALTEEASDG